MHIKQSVEKASITLTENLNEKTTENTHIEMAIIWTIVLLFCNAFFAVALYLKRKRLTGEPPLVSHLIPFVGGAVAFGKDPVGYLKELQKKFGNVFSLEIAGWNYHVFTHPLDIKNLEKSRVLEYESVVGDFATRLLGSEHSIHNQQKPVHEDINSFQQRNKAIPQAIKNNLRGFSQMENLYQSCVQNTTKIIKQLKGSKIEIPQKDNEVKLNELSKDLIYHITYNIMLGSLPNEEEHLKEAKTLSQHFKKFNEKAVLLQDRVPIHTLPGTKKARVDILESLRSMNMEERENVSDMIRSVLETDTNEKNQIRHMMVLLWTGQANTAPGLFWSLYYILKHHEARQEILKEFENVTKVKKRANCSVGVNSMNSKITLDDFSLLEKQDLDKMVVLESVLKEVMRVSGSSMNVRKVAADTTIKTHDNKRFNLRKGDYTMFYSPIMHLDSEVHKESEKFVFDRFLKKPTSDHSDSDAESETESKKQRLYFSKDGKEISESRSILTFGFGGGKCPGRHLALMEIKLMILALFTCFDPTLISRHTPKPDLTHIGFGIMPPASDVLISL